MAAIGTTRVEEVMITNIVTVNESAKMEDVASVFKEQDINAAPVVAASGNCVGIITSHDLVAYESDRSAVLKKFCSSEHAASIFASDEGFRIPGSRYDEAGFHMSTCLHTASLDDPLSQVAKVMCREHIHHVIVLGDKQEPIGFLSSLDLLGFIVGEPVCRSATCRPSN